MGAPSLDSESQALYDMVAEVAAPIVDAGAATVSVSWAELGGPHAWPTVDLIPTRRDSCAISLSWGGHWIDTMVGLAGNQTNFEVWEKTWDQMLLHARERVVAVIDGRIDIVLRRGRFLGWKVVATFHLPSGPDKTSRSPARPAEFRDLFPSGPQDGRARILGPRTFAPYL